MIAHVKQYANPELQAELARTAGSAIIRLGGNRLSERWLTQIEALKDIGLITDDDGLRARRPAAAGGRVTP